MKKQIQAIQFFILTILLTSNFSLEANNNIPTSNTCDLLAEVSSYSGPFTYSWSSASGATSYVVQAVNTNTQVCYCWETSITSVSAFGIPSGTYSLTVKANFSNNTSSIIIHDIVEH